MEYDSEKSLQKQSINQMDKLIAIIALMFLLSCENIEPRGYKYEQGSLPDSPVNLELFNSEYDDYNSTAPSLGRLIPFCFSTNRNSQGGNFDIIYQPMNVNFDKTSGVLKVTNDYANWSIFIPEYGTIQNAMSKINTSGNEFGPYLTYYQNTGFVDSDFLLLYASDLSGDFEISYTFNKDKSSFSEGNPVKFLNSEFNDLYPSFNSDFSKIYFCSERDNGNFDIFYVNISKTDKEIIKVLSDSSYKEVFKEEALSGDYDDKCPYIFGNMLIFSSNRPGGYGGFDIYYSKFENEKWSTPTNFGSKINSISDEYRPIIFDEEVDFEKDMMVFSSDRTGGKGGFDLYFVGVEKTD